MWVTVSVSGSALLLATAVWGLHEWLAAPGDPWRGPARAAAVVTVLACAVFGVVTVLSREVARCISGRIRELAEAAERVSRTEDYSIRVPRAGARDELGVLVGVFNEMLGKLQERDAVLAGHRVELAAAVERRTAELAEACAQLKSEIAERERSEQERRVLHLQLVRTSREAGMAEVATNVLHNVGNVLNSVHVSCCLIAQKVEASPVGALVRTAGLLRSRGADLAEFLGGEGRALPEYLEVLAGHLEDERAQLLQEIAGLRRNLDHVEEIVAAQQSFAQRSGAVESVRVSEVIEQALALVAGLEQQGIRIVREYAEVPSVDLDRNSLLGILANLIRNAQQAMQPGTNETVLVLRTRKSLRRHGFVEIEVCDSGVGIAPCDLTRIFSHGFTTKAGGHGFGLHSAALAAQELGGALSVASAGLGRGASFTLQLPAAA